MVSSRTLRFFRQVAFLWLKVRVHFDALVRSPSPYLTAVKWWILGKRVRARGQLAPLLAGSSKAYEWWTLQHRPIIGADSDGTEIGIVALVAVGNSTANLSKTLQSLKAEKIPAYVIRETGESDCVRKNLQEAALQIDWRQTDWLLPIRAGDLLAEGAGAAYRHCVHRSSPDCSVIYADDDLLDRWDYRKTPHFKPDWNSELYRHHDFLTGACIIRGSESTIVGAGLNTGWQQRIVAAAALTGTVFHIPEVLHHRATRDAPAPRPSPVEVASALPMVSVIIPTRNRADLLRTCISGLGSTAYPALEIIVVDNGSDEPASLNYLEELAGQGITVLPQPGPFNYSVINNNAVAIARGELICLLNNDIEVLTPDWLQIMATQALRPEVGAVGAQLLYPDGRIQHAGVVIGVGNAAGHAHRFLLPEAEGYFRRHALPQYVSAVTAACLVVKKQKFLDVGGLDEKNFAVAYNDVDLCLRLNAQGWQSFYEPRAVMVHHESVSRGHDHDPVGAARFAGELRALKRLWRTEEVVDPFHHPNLSRASEQFAIGLLS